MKKLAASLSLFLVPLAAGCYDDGTKEDCVGLKCPNGFQWPEGGEIRAWYILMPDGTELRRLAALFIDEQTPDVPLPEPPIGRCAPDVTGAQGENRKYLDVGEEVTFDFGDQEITIPRQVAEPDAPIVDWYHRHHDVAYLWEGIDPTTSQFFNNSHSARTADSMPFSDRLDGLFMPPRFEVLSPQGDPVVTFNRGEDVVFEWREEETRNPNIVTGAAIVFVPDAPVIPTACIVANSGRFVVPAEVIEGLEADTGIMLIGSAADEAVLTDDGRILHKWGLQCTLLPWSRVD